MSSINLDNRTCSGSFKKTNNNDDSIPLEIVTSDFNNLDVNNDTISREEKKSINQLEMIINNNITDNNLDDDLNLVCSNNSSLAENSSKINSSQCQDDSSSNNIDSVDDHEPLGLVLDDPTIIGNDDLRNHDLDDDFYDYENFECDNLPAIDESIIKNCQINTSTLDDDDNDGNTKIDKQLDEDEKKEISFVNDDFSNFLMNQGINNGINSFSISDIDNDTDNNHSTINKIDNDLSKNNFGNFVFQFSENFDDDNSKKINKEKEIYLDDKVDNIVDEFKINDDDDFCNFTESVDNYSSLMTRGEADGSSVIENQEIESAFNSQIIDSSEANLAGDVFGEFSNISTSVVAGEDFNTVSKNIEMSQPGVFDVKKDKELTGWKTNEDDDDFGDFADFSNEPVGVVAPEWKPDIQQPILSTNNTNNPDDDDEFGDFEDFESYATPVKATVDNSFDLKESMSRIDNKNVSLDAFKKFLVHC